MCLKQTRVLARESEAVDPDDPDELVHNEPTVIANEHRSSGFPTRSDTNGALQPQKMARSLRFWI